MNGVGKAVEDVRVLLETGGPVLPALLALSFVLWALLLERIWYARRVHPERAREIATTWQARTERSSWSAHQIRRMVLSRASQKLRAGLPLIRALVTLCPLLGLLGTVTGMIEVFDVMAFDSSGNARAMANGVSRATLPTLAGMVVALSGLFLSARLDRNARAEIEELEDRLVFG